MSSTSDDESIRLLTKQFLSSADPASKIRYWVNKTQYGRSRKTRPHPTTGYWQTDAFPKAGWDVGHMLEYWRRSPRCDACSVIRPISMHVRMYSVSNDKWQLGAKQVVCGPCARWMKTYGR